MHFLYGFKVENKSKKQRLHTLYMLITRCIDGSSASNPLDYNLNKALVDDKLAVLKDVLTDPRRPTNQARVEKRLLPVVVRLGHDDIEAGVANEFCIQFVLQSSHLFVSSFLDSR